MATWEELIKYAYVDLVVGRAIDDEAGGVTILPLDENDLGAIGKFTRENIIEWIESHHGPDWVGLFPVWDLHAVCGGIEIPWASEESKQLFEKHEEAIRQAYLKWSAEAQARYAERNAGKR